MQDARETRCEVNNYRIVVVEEHGDTAIALVVGHADVGKEEHPFVEVSCPVFILFSFLKGIHCCPCHYKMKYPSKLIIDYCKLLS